MKNVILIELKLNWNWTEIELKLNWYWTDIELKLTIYKPIYEPTFFDTLKTLDYFILLYSFASP